MAPFDKIEVWKQHVEGRATQQVNKKGMERLNTIIKGLVLRRSKQDTGLDGKELVRLLGCRIIHLSTLAYIFILM